jgi:hypothetical protein
MGAEFAVELFGPFHVFQSSLAAFASCGVDKRNLLKARVVITTLYLACISPVHSLCATGEPESGFGGRPIAA